MSKTIQTIGIILLLLSFCFMGCVENPNEPVITKIHKSYSLEKGKYIIWAEAGQEAFSFWSDKEYHIGDTLVRKGIYLPEDFSNISLDSTHPDTIVVFVRDNTLHIKQ